MNDITITLVGFVALPPRYTITRNGTPLMSLRVGSTPRRFDRESGQWRDGETMFVTAQCWRALADNLNNSELQQGDPVIVTGRLRIRDFERDGQRLFSAEVEATTVGHDLTRGSARFQRSQRSSITTAEDRQIADKVADDWARETEDAGRGGGLSTDGERAAAAPVGDIEPAVGDLGPSEVLPSDRESAETDDGEFGQAEVRAAA